MLRESICGQYRLIPIVIRPRGNGPIGCCIQIVRHVVVLCQRCWRSSLHDLMMTRIVGKTGTCGEYPHGYIRQANGHTGSTCLILIDIATPPRQVWPESPLRNPERKKTIHRGTPDMCCALAPLSSSSGFFCFVQTRHVRMSNSR